MGIGNSIFDDVNRFSVTQVFVYKQNAISYLFTETVKINSELLEINYDQYY